MARQRKQKSRTEEPDELLALAEEGFERALSIDRPADQSKERRGWWDRMFQALHEQWAERRVERLEALQREECPSCGKDPLSVRRDEVEGEETPSTPGGETLQ